MIVTPTMSACTRVPSTRAATTSGVPSIITATMWTMTTATIFWPPQKLVGPLWETTKEERLGKLESRSKSVEHCSQEYISRRDGSSILLKSWAWIGSYSCFKTSRNRTTSISWHCFSMRVNGSYILHSSRTPIT